MNKPPRQSFFLALASAVIATLLAVLTTACSTMPPVPPADARVQHCMVCRHRRDFSCLEVERKPGTPQSEYAGRNYCFCSNECREEFRRQPERYAVKSR